MEADFRELKKEEMKEEDFLFSLQSNCYLRAINSNGEILEGYYVVVDRSTGTVSIREHASVDAKSDLRTGVKTLKSFEKFAVNYFGELSPIVKEKRLGLAKRTNSKSRKAKLAAKAAGARKGQ